MQSLGYLEDVLKLDERVKPLFILSIDDIPVNVDGLPVGLYLFVDELGQVFARHISLGEFSSNW